MTAGSADALFVPVEEGWLPTELARGPWSPDALHGGPVAALVARAAEQAARPEPTTDSQAGEPLHTVRLSVELLRPVPLAPLEVVAQVVRPGHKVQVVDVTVRHAGNAVVFGRAVRIRSRALGHGLGAWGDGPHEGAPEDPAPPSPVPAPDTGGRWLRRQPGDLVAFHNGGAELRFADGDASELGPATVWVRLQAPVVPGEEPSPVQRAAAAADFANGISAVLPFDEWRFVNPDLTVTLSRPPQGPWVALQATTTLGAPGIGVATAVLSDQHGPVGTGIQTLVVEPRHQQPR